MESKQRYDEIQALAKPFGLEVSIEIFGDNFHLERLGQSIMKGEYDTVKAFLSCAVTVQSMIANQRERLGR